MKEAEALRHKSRNVITNFVGNNEMRIEIGPRINMGINDTLLVASDGLFDNLLSDLIVETIRKGSLLAQTETLAALAGARMSQRTAANNDLPPGKPDDLTLLTFRR